jgi:hypothetical protein
MQPGNNQNGAKPDLARGGGQRQKQAGDRRRQPNPSDVQAATHAAGSDSNNGSLGAPWLTLAHSFATMLGEDTLNLRGSGAVDIEGSFLNPMPSGTLGAPTTIQAFAGDPRPIVQPPPGPAGSSS